MNNKAVGPVVASIILIAVTVSVSIAVAAWMGALAVSFMQENVNYSINVPQIANATHIKYRLLNVNTNNVLDTYQNFQSLPYTIEGRELNGTVLRLEVHYYALTEDTTIITGKNISYEGQWKDLGEAVYPTITITKGD